MVAQIVAHPPAIGGMNVRDRLIDLEPTDAQVLKNLYPTEAYLVTRGGHSQYVDLDDTTGGTPDWAGGGSVDTLANLTRGATTYFIAASEGGWADISTSSPTSLVNPSTYNDDRWQWIEFDDSATPNTPELYLVNGHSSDAPLTYNGSTIATWAVPGTGLTDNDIIGIQTFKNAVYVWEKDERDFWYSQVGEVSSDFKRFPLSAVRGAQGNIIAMDGWTRDAGSGPDDFLVIVTDQGSVLIYQGSHPDIAADWAIVGVYQIPPPIDARCITKILDDVLIVTQQDIYLLSQVIRNQGISGTSSKVASYIQDAFGDYGTITGWEVKVWPKGARAYLNIPTSTTTAKQIVINTKTLAACEYEGYNARTFGVYDNAIYFADGAGIIWTAEDGAQDNGAEISWCVRTGAHRFQYPGVKTLQAVRVQWGVSGTIDFGLDAASDLREPNATVIDSSGDSTGWVWDSGTGEPDWEDIRWNTLSNLKPQATWRVVHATGQHIAVEVAGRFDDIAGRIYGFDYAWENGGWV